MVLSSVRILLEVKEFAKTHSCSHLRLLHVPKARKHTLFQSHVWLQHRRPGKDACMVEDAWANEVWPLLQITSLMARLLGALVEETG